MERAPTLRSERMIAIARTVLAGSSLFALWLDPSEPANLAPIAYGLLAAYLGYSGVHVLLAFRPGPGLGRRATLLTHAGDLVLFSAFVYFTSGPSSPFTAYFVFSLACGTLRWGWRGALWTGAGALVAFVAVGAYFATVLRDPGFQLSPFLIRGFYLGVIASLFASLGAHEEQLRREATALAGAGAASEERIRLARDLHDGVLQSFTGFGLRLAAIRRQLGEGLRDEAADGLEELQRLIRLDQRDLRFFISELQPAGEGREGGPPSLATRLEELKDRIELTWDVAVELELGDRIEPPSEADRRDAYLLVREAAVNAIRHGGAATVRVALDGGGGEPLRIVVEDDGRGFPFHGVLDQDELRTRDVGPRTLLQRLAARGGRLSVDSREQGATVRMEMATEERT